jgi:hypothetical protein
MRYNNTLFVCIYLFSVQAAENEISASDEPLERWVNHTESFLRANDTYSQKDAPDKEFSEKSTSCRLYLAESSILDAGWGIYSAKEIEKGERIFEGDLVCNIEDYEENMQRRRRFLAVSNKDDPTWLLDNYIWASWVTLAVFEAVNVTSIIPGVGTLANGHPALFNALPRNPKRYADLNRAYDPGAGASTHFHDAQFIATKPIEAGAEIFLDYGESWFEERHQNIGNVPLSSHWKHADDVLKKFSEIVDGNYETKRGRDMYRLLQFAVKVEPRITNVLPDDISGVPKAQSIK